MKMSEGAQRQNAILRVVGRIEPEHLHRLARLDECDVLEGYVREMERGDELEVEADESAELSWELKELRRTVDLLEDENAELRAQITELNVKLNAKVA